MRRSAIRRGGPSGHILGFEMASNSAFTLIELIVVISLISIMLVFSIPRFHAAVLSDPDRQTSRWITETVKTLKHESVRDNTRYVMHIDIGGNRGWVTHDNMSEEAISEAQLQGFSFPEDTVIVDVEFPGKGKISSETTEISFYKKGYSDKALIHVEFPDGGVKTYLIEPFLPRVIITNTYSEFEY